jgi:hypothetical protein
VGPSFSTVVVGNLQEADTQEMLTALRKPYLPNLVVSLKVPGKAGLGYEKMEGKATAYVCQDQMCLPPTSSVETMLSKLKIG